MSVNSNIEKDYKNEFISILDEYSGLLMKRGDFIKAKIYRRAHDNLVNYSEPIYSVDELASITGFGPGIMKILKEYVSTGKITALENERKRPENVLANIYGIGPKKARELVNNGITSISKLREEYKKNPKLLNDVQTKGLTYYDDIIQRIPRSEIVQYNKVFDKIFNNVKDDTSKYEIVGSYRRGSQTSGDIDLIITSKNKDVFVKFVDKLLENNIIIEILSRGPTKSLVICKLDKQSVARRVDFLYSTYEEYPFSILYFTGSKDFNTVMRGYALTLGYSLNEHGLYKKEKGKKKEDKITDTFLSERDIFDFLGLVYKEPNERIGGNDVLKKDGTPVKLNDTMNKDDTKTLKNTVSRSVNKTQKAEGTIKSIQDIIDSIPQEIESTPVVEETAPVVAVTKKKRGRPKGSKNKTQKNVKQQGSIIEKNEEPETKPKQDMVSKSNKEKMETISEVSTIKSIQDIIDSIPSEMETTPVVEETAPVVSVSEPLVEETAPAVVAVTKKKRGRPKGSKNKTQKNVKQQGSIIEKNEEPEIKPEQDVVSKSNKEKMVENSIDTNTEKDKMKTKKPKLTMKEGDVVKMMEEFKTKGISVLESLSKTELEQIVLVANKQFHSYVEQKGEPTLTDNEYDIIKEYIEQKYSDASVLNEIGAEFEKNKVKLPVNMPSMDKIKPTTNALTTWVEKYKGPYVLSCKLDGVSGLYYSKDGQRKLYTRGNGSVGQDVSHLLKYVNGIPDIQNVIVRGEFIISKKIFDDKYSKQFSNARNLVAGIVNSKKVDKKAKDVDFISYEMIEPELKPSDQMKTMRENGFNVVKNEVTSTLSNNMLSDILTDWRTNYEYIIDGIIVSDDNIYKRTNKNPDHSFAFKMVMSDQVVEAKVVDVIWNASKSGYLKPRVRIEPVHVGGVKIEYATGFNGNFIEENKIGVGAIIQIVRSGDVIPHIKSVTTPAERPKMPDIPYKWTDTHVDIILENKEDDVNVLEKNITSFFTSLEVDGLSQGNVKRIMNAGYNSICKILDMEEKDFLNVDGFKDKMAKKIYESIRDKMKNATLIQIMAASNKFGRGIGERKITPIMNAFPKILEMSESDEDKIKMLMSVKGIGKENAKSFVENIPVFLEFMKQCKITQKQYAVPMNASENKELSNINKDHPLYDKKIVMTKVRDKEIIDKLSTFGAYLENNVNKNTFALIVKSKDDVSNKTKKANELGVPIFTPEEFIEKYLTTK